MKFRILTFSVMIFLTITGCTALNLNPSTSIINSNSEKTSELFSIFLKGEKTNNAQLKLFLSKMPKGGDLHHHYSGSIYVETYIDWVERAGYWINKNTLKIDKYKTVNSVSVAALKKDNKLYSKLLTVWSDKDYTNHYHDQPPPDSNFFNTFGFFGPISDYSYNDGFKILKERARKENVIYIETMLAPVGYSKSDSLFDAAACNTNNDKELQRLFDSFVEKIDSDKQFNVKLQNFSTVIAKAHADIDSDEFMMRYQTYVSRNSQPSIVFSGLYAGFKTAYASKLVVGVNIVGPENGVIALKDYHLHMKMFNYLSQKFPEVNKALHAGELALGMVRPKDLKFHIWEAVNIAKAQRIGHGVDLPFEDYPIKLLKQIKQNSCIEINLTSNEFILGIKGQDHPYLIYSDYNVPIVICTDDSGVSRNNLTNEYLLLSIRYKPSYQDIKKYVYNSIDYSFLSKQEKVSMRNVLHSRFAEFEKEMAIYYETINPDSA